MIIELTREINNKDGYIDEVCAQIRAIPAGEELELRVTSEGGLTAQGARLFRAALEHRGKTKFVGIGIVASMAAVLSAAFDEVEWDYDCEIMFHGAGIQGVEQKDLPEDARKIISNFNDRAYARLESKGVDPEFLDAVFKSKERKDFYITPIEAENLGLGKLVKIERRDTAPFKVAAQLKEKRDKCNMGIFNRKMALTRTGTLKDGRVFVFKSENETVAKGDTIELVGSGDLLTNEVELENGMVLKMGEGNEVADVAEAPKPDIVAELVAKVEALTAEIEAMKKKEYDDEDELKAKKEKEEKAKKEVEAKDKQIANLSEKVSVLTEAFASIKSDFKLDSIENKHEQEQKGGLEHLTESELRAYEMRQIVAGTKMELK